MRSRDIAQHETRLAEIRDAMRARPHDGRLAAQGQKALTAYQEALARDTRTLPPANAEPGTRGFQRDHFNGRLDARAMPKPAIGRLFGADRTRKE